LLVSRTITHAKRILTMVSIGVFNDSDVLFTTLQCISCWTTGVRFLAEAGIFSLRHRAQTGPGVRSSSYPLGTGTLSPGTKRLGRKADLSPPSSAEVSSAWSYTSTPQYTLVACCLI